MDRSPTLEHRITEQVAEEILAQRLRPGEHIVADRIARALGVSRLPVREALRNLAGHGLVELHPHRGAFVTMVHRELLVETLEVRALLEPRAAALCAVRHQPGDLAALDRIIEHGSAAARARERAAVHRAHHRFLRELGAMGRHAALDAALAPLHHHTLLGFAVGVLQVDPDGWAEHAAVRDAIAARDADAARARTAEHLASVLISVRARPATAPIGSRGIRRTAGT